MLILKLAFTIQNPLFDQKNKIMKHLLILTILTSALFFANIQESQAQCKKFTKTDCLPLLEPFTYNGQLNSATLSEGDVAELLLTFHKDHKYRICVCSQDMIGDVRFKIFDTKKNLIFEQVKGQDQPFWDFASKSSQQLIIQVTVPTALPKSEITKSGCVSILVGFLNE